MGGIAITRAVPTSFARAVAARPQPIDVPRAMAQHAAYVEALRSLHLEVIVLPEEERFPDCCFVEDTALVAGGIALATIPGAPSRRGEVDAVASILAVHLPVTRMESPATIDGGDCMVLGSVIFIGRSARTNDAGIALARDLFAPRGFEVVPVPLAAGVLHLKCVCSPLPGGRVLLADGTIPPETFRGAPIVSVPAEESYAANCLALGDTALASAGFPAAHRALLAAGLRVVSLDTSEFRKADGALTCLSVLVS